MPMTRRQWQEFSPSAGALRTAAGSRLSGWVHRPDKRKLRSGL